LEKTNKRKWRWGKNRWLILLFVILGFFGANQFPPVQPHIQVAPEKLIESPLITLPVIGEIYLSNTMTAMVIVDIILILMVIGVQKAVRTGSMLPKGITGIVESLFEMLFNLTESSAGVKWAKTIFPFFSIILLFVLVANFTKLLPGYETIGLLHHSEHGAAVSEIIPGISTLVKGDVQPGMGYGLVGFLRGLPTDLNFTLALALFSVVMTQLVGIRARGLGYFLKFFNVRTIFSKPGFGLIDLLVSILELISEFAKILSFSFRLFGNMFAGLVLLILVGSLIPVFLQSGVLLFELFIGLIQAFVFGMLTMVFMSQATQGHGGEDHATGDA
jgi:F-type H+-transporting ATPase subunit a